MYKRLADEEAEHMEETREKMMDLMADKSKPHFTNILWNLTNLGQLIWSKYQPKTILSLTFLKTFQ